MAGKFIPNSDRQFADKAQEFARTIARDPARFMLSLQDAEEITLAMTRFRDALAVVCSAGSRTKLTTTEKAQARAVAEQVVRKYANVVRANPQISVIDKLALGIQLRPPRQRARRCPQTPPVLKFIRSCAEGDQTKVEHVLYFCEQIASGTKGKPAGAARIELFVDLVDPSDPIPGAPGQITSAWPLYLRSYTRSPIRVRFPMPARPMRVVYWARWADATGEVGPFSPTCIAPVVCGNVSKAALVDERDEQRRPTKCIITIRDVSQRRLEQVETEALLLEDASMDVEPLEVSAQKQLPEAA